MRFDFAHFEPVSAEQLTEIEALVNEQVRLNHDADIRELPYDEAIAAGALAFFGDKYGDKVRVLKLGEFSTELCGGTHVGRSGDIGLFKIVSEGGIAAGVRRIEAVTGQGALALVNANEAVLREIAGLVKANKDDVAAKVEQLVERTRTLERELSVLRRKLASGGGRDILQEAQVVNGIKVLAARLDGADAKALRDTADQLKSKLGSGVVVLGAVDGDKVFLVASVTQDLGRPAQGRRASSSPSPSSSAAAAAAGRTSRRPAAPSPIRSMPRWRSCRGSSRRPDPPRVCLNLPPPRSSSLWVVFRLP